MTTPQQTQQAETAEGRIDLISWLVSLQKPVYSIISKPGSAITSDNDADRILTAYSVLHHETVHFWHAISTRFLYKYTCEYLDRCIRVLHDIAKEENGCGDFPFTAHRDAFRDIESWLSLASAPDPTYGAIRAIDVVEGCAALCSFRMTWPRKSHSDFKGSLENEFTVYRWAYQYAASLLDEVAFDLFPPACYLALQYDNPASALKCLLDDTYYLLYKHPKTFGSRSADVEAALRKRIHVDPLSFLLLGRDMKEEDCFLMLLRRKSLQGRDTHIVLDPDIKTVAIADVLRVIDVFARPYTYSWDFVFGNSPEGSEADSLRSLVLTLLPPLFSPLDTSQQFFSMGLGRRLGKSYLGAVIGSYATAGIVERVVFDARHQMPCPHRDCRVYKTSLCHKFYGLPRAAITTALAPDTVEPESLGCSFPDLLKAVKLSWLPTCEEVRSVV